MKTLDTIQQIVSTHPDKQILFDTPVLVKKTPHHTILECWGINVQAGLWLMDERGQWHEWCRYESNAQLVISSIYQRVKVLQLKAA